MLLLKCVTFVFVNYYNQPQGTESLEADTCSSNQGIFHILWNPEIRHFAHKSPPIGPILYHINPLHSIAFCFFKTYFHSVLQSTLVSCKWPLSFELLYQTPVCIFLFPNTCHCPAQILIAVMIFNSSLTAVRA